jgi:hypothetical protein
MEYRMKRRGDTVLWGLGIYLVLIAAIVLLAELIRLR